METYESFEDLGAPAPEGEEATDAGADEQPIAGGEEDQNEEEEEDE